MRYLVSGDADTVYQPAWLRAVWARLECGADMVSRAGYMDTFLWSRCPRLASRYIENVGSIFFDPGTILRLEIDENECLFTRKVYSDFGRPACSLGFAITVDAYVRLGGFRREFYDHAHEREVLIAALPLMFRAERAGTKIDQVERPWWLTSSRRLVSEPAAQLGREFQHTAMDDYRAVNLDAYWAFDADADRFDYHGLRLNCVRDYPS